MIKTKICKFLKSICDKVCHRVEHKFKLNHGHAETFRDENGIIMIGFRCECGELLSVAPMYLTDRGEEYASKDHESRKRESQGIDSEWHKGKGYDN